MLRGAQLEQAKNQYTALHEGLEPRGTVTERIRPYTQKKVILGRISEIQYFKIVPDGNHRYHHPFAPRAMPTLFVDMKRRLGIYRGRYVVTHRGIEDRSYLTIEDESLPGRANRLITLGKLDFIRYKWVDKYGNEHEDEINFSSGTAPTISHDQNGDLHVTGGRANLESVMKKAMKKGRSTRARRNPSGDFNSMAKRTLEYSFVVGLGATATAMAMDAALAKRDWSLRNKAIFKMVAGPALALGAAYALPTFPALAASLGVGGVIAGGKDLYVMYVQRRINGMMGGTTTAQVGSGTTPPSASTPPAGFASLPAGRVPAGYAQYQGQACG